MSDQTKQILCGACRVPLEAPANPQPDDRCSCPRCGQHDTLENVVAEVRAFAKEATARFMQETMRKTARSSKMFHLTLQPIEKGSYRFVVELNLGGA